ncbi:MAG: hypothetical protein LBC07_06625 [Elusimicrobiota bacterium]|jgi:hypothetical protein|nr:hypothetical protein [Elusimicrobiota bacterium]
MLPDIKYEIVRNIGVLSVTKSGWKKEVKIIKWISNNKENIPKIDIRDWSPDGTKMGKGITLDREEAAKLIDLLKEAGIQLSEIIRY